VTGRRNPKASNPKWRAAGARIVPRGACGKDDQVIYRLRRQWSGTGPGIFIYRCREHSDITDPTDPEQVEW
jgi:hypothetical protein